MRKILVAFNDTHAGHKLGLMNPEVQLIDWTEDGEPVTITPALTRTQSYLWKIFLQDIENVKAIADGAEILVLHTGDETQGDKYPKSWVTTRKDDQILIALWNFEPLMVLPNVKWVRLAIGTEAHNFGEGSSTIAVTRHLGQKYPDKNVRVTYHGLLRYNDTVIDYAHHGPHPGTRSWLNGNVARFYLRDIISRAYQNGEEIPDAVLRAHFHQPCAVIERIRGIHNKDVLLHVVPSYSGVDDHAQQAARSPDRLTNGMLVLEIEDGRIVRDHELYHSIDIRTKEIIR